MVRLALATLVIGLCGVVSSASAGEIAGTIRDEAGNSVGGARVECWLDTGVEILEAATDDAGRFAFAEPRAREVRIYAAKDGHVPALLEPGSPAAAAALPLELVLPHTGAIDGVLATDAGEPLPETPVYLYAHQSSEEWWRSRALAEARTDESGRFSFERLAPGEYFSQVRPRIDDASGKQTAIRVESWKRAQVEIRYETQLVQLGYRPISGIVVDANGTAVAGVRVTATPTCHGVSGKYEAATDRDGRFVLFQWLEYPCDLHATSSGASSVRVEVKSEDAGDVRIVLPPLGSIRGRVVDADTGLPVPSFDLAVFNIGAGWSTEIQDLVVRSIARDDGSFEIDGLDQACGRWAVVATVPGRTGAIACIDFTKQSTPAEVVLAIGKTKRHAGHVQDQDGLPLSGALVLIMGGSGGLIPSLDGAAITASDGSFAVSGGPTTARSVRVGLAGYTEWNTTVDSARADSPDDIAVTLCARANVRGRIVRDGIGVAGVPVSAYQRDSPGSGAIGDSAPTDVHGRFEL
ncbi:MAG: carboxypeptidase-like regulatory domain-containing protein [Planctomycetes bacterium]|nr:carboxypeptidase-like regulatory domain-containing protein [Planctomycetota bacterium]